ncbi:MAG: extracellular solute-binding protein [Thermomicrobia bacterium]|nr:extracellular solute-binding protein [Thermomicrobia bacterium]MCA1724494.1 extracellular solute-binding protein [Thermomicrobia bacterium]
METTQRTGDRGGAEDQAVIPGTSGTRVNRRRFLAIASAASIAALLAACGGSSAATNTPAPAKPTTAGAAPAGSAAPAATTAAAAPSSAPAVSGKGTYEIVHWSTLTASDADIWQKMIDSYNAAHKDQGVQIRMEVIPDDQYGTKILSSAATGVAPDFGWADAGVRLDWVNKGVVQPLDDVFKQIGFDLSDFSEQALNAAKYNGKLCNMPMDAMSLQVLVNTDHVKEAGLDITKPPKTGDELLMWADKMTQRSGDKVTRSGWLMTGSGLQPTVVWGLVAQQMGFRRTDPDLKQAAINPDAGKQAAQWVLDLFDKDKVSTRDVTDRYKAFGTGDGSMFWTGPWTLNGYIQQKLPFATILSPTIGKDPATYYELGGLEMYVQKDKSRYQMTAQALKWLSDNSFLWTTVGRGISPRKSIVNRPDYKTAGPPASVRGAFLDGVDIATVGEVPVAAADDFEVYTGSGFITKTMDPVWAKQTSIDSAISALAKQWQQDLAAK